MNILIFSTIAKCLTSFLKLFMSFLTVVFTQSVQSTAKDIPAIFIYLGIYKDIQIS